MMDSDTNRIPLSHPEDIDALYSEIFSLEVEAMEHTFTQFSEMLHASDASKDAVATTDDDAESKVTDRARFATLFSDEVGALEDSLKQFSEILQEDDKENRFSSFLSLEDGIDACSFTSFENEEEKVDMSGPLMKPLDKIILGLSNDDPDDPDDQLIFQVGSIDSIFTRDSMSHIGHDEEGSIFSGIRMQSWPEKTQVDPIESELSDQDDCTIGCLRLLYKKETMPQAIMNILLFKPEPLEIDFPRLMEDLESKGKTLATERTKDESQLVTPKECRKQLREVDTPNASEFDACDSIDCRAEARDDVEKDLEIEETFSNAMARMELNECQRDKPVQDREKGDAMILLKDCERKDTDKSACVVIEGETTSDGQATQTMPPTYSPLDGMLSTVDGAKDEEIEIHLVPSNAIDKHSATDTASGKDESATSGVDECLMTIEDTDCPADMNYTTTEASKATKLEDGETITTLKSQTSIQKEVQYIADRNGSPSDAMDTKQRTSIDILLRQSNDVLPVGTEAPKPQEKPCIDVRYRLDPVDTTQDIRTHVSTFATTVVSEEMGTNRIRTLNFEHASPPCIYVQTSESTTRSTEPEDRISAPLTTFKIDTKFDLDDDDNSIPYEETQTPKIINGVSFSSPTTNSKSESHESNRFSFYESNVWDHWPFSSWHQDTKMPQQPQQQALFRPTEFQLQKDTDLSTISGSCSFVYNANHRSENTMEAPKIEKSTPTQCTSNPPKTNRHGFYTSNFWDHPEDNPVSHLQQEPAPFQLQKDTDLSTISGSYSLSDLVDQMRMDAIDPSSTAFDLEDIDKRDTENRSTTSADLIQGRKVLSPRLGGSNTQVSIHHQRLDHQLLDRKKHLPSAVSFRDDTVMDGSHYVQSASDVSSVSNVSSAKMLSEEDKKLAFFHPSPSDQNKGHGMVDRLLLEQSASDQTGNTSGMSDSLFQSVTMLMHASKNMLNNMLMGQA